MRGSRLGHVGPRHPLCPGCGYDLVATIEARRRRCPECGYDFEMDELVLQARDGDWTPWRGVRHAGVILALKGLAGAGVWALVVTLEHRLGLTGLPRLPIALSVLVAGGAVGWWLAHRIDEHLGFAGVVVAAGLAAVAFVVLGLGATLAIRLGGAPAGPTTFALFVSGLASIAFIVKKTVLDEG